LNHNVISVLVPQIRAHPKLTYLSGVCSNFSFFVAVSGVYEAKQLLVLPQFQETVSLFGCGGQLFRRLRRRL